jgi:hypothetical protein
MLYLRSINRFILVSLALLGLLLLNTTAAQASLVKVETFWQSPNNGNAFLDTTAFLEMTSFTGIGTELISVTSFDLVFGDLRPGIPDTILTAELSSSNEVFIHFINGAVSTYCSTPGIGLDPGNTSFVINPSLGRLSRNFPFVGQANYTLQPGSVVTLPSAVPVPAAIWLFGTGILGLIGFSKRDKSSLNYTKGLNSKPRH